MSFFDEAPPTRKISDSRVNAWNKQKVHTFEDVTFKQMARQAQDAASNSFNPGSRMSKTTSSLPRDKLPSNSYANKVAQSIREGAHAISRGEAELTTGNQRSNSPRNGNAPVGPTNFTKNAPSGLQTQTPSPSVKTVESTSTPKGDETKLPPHLRHLSVNSKEEDTPPTNKLSKRGTRAAPTMNSGTVAKSAKLASNFPCTYNDCTQGFEKEKAMKKHKEQEHHYCRLCDEDCNDFDELLNHKLHSEEHICCCVCGQDFHSEGGRDRHERQVNQCRDPLSTSS